MERFAPMSTNRRPLDRVVAAVALTAALLGAPSVAFADDSVVILGFQSLEGDDDFALSLSGALRHAATQISDWDVSDREVTLDQMSLAHGCDEPNAACMAQIAGTLESDRVIFGTIMRTSNSGDFDFEVTVQIYDARAGEIAETITDRIPRVRSDIDQLRARVDRYVEQLAGTVSSGVLVVASNVEGAEVFVDGDSLGFIVGGELRSQLPAGDHEIDVRSDGYDTWSDSVTVTASSSTAVDATLSAGGGTDIPGGTEPSPGGGVSQSTLGWAAIGVGSAGLITAMISWFVLDGIGDLGVGLDLDLVDNNEHVTNYRNTVGEVDDFCTQAEGGTTPDEFSRRGGSLSEVQSACSRASTFTALYYTGLIVGLVAGGIGTFLIVTDDGEQNPADTGERLTLTPVLSPQTAGMSAALTF